MNNITNTKPRRLSMAYFTGLFLLAVAVPCVAFIKSVKLNTALPQKELKELQEKESIVKMYADLSDALRNYQTAQTAKSPDAMRLATECKNMIMGLYSKLGSKDTSKVYQDLNRSLQMANQYYEYIQNSNLTQSQVNPLIAQLQSEKQALQNENQILKIQLASKPAAAPAGGGGGGAPRVEYIKVPAECPPCPTGSAAAPCNCEGQVTAYKQKIYSNSIGMVEHINNIRREVNNIECFIGKNKKEKASIDQSLLKLDSGLRNLQNQ